MSPPELSSETTALVSAYHKASIAADKNEATEAEKKAKITVQDVGFILKTTLNEVVVDVKNIKKYTDSVVIKVVNITKN